MKTQVRRWVLVVAALSAVAAFGCSKDSGGGAGGSAGAKGALGMLPKDADVVMGVDFASLRSSALYKEYSPMLISAMGDKLAKFKDTCGFDPIEQIGTLTAGVKGDKADQDVTMVVTGFSKDKVVDCLKKAAEKEGKGNEVKIDGDYVEIAAPKGTVGALFTDAGILIHKTASGFATKDALVAQSKQAADASPAGSKTFMDVFGKVDTKSGFWFVANGNAPQMQSSPVKMKVAWGSIKVSDGLSADIAATMNSEADAKQIVDMAKAQLDQVKGAGMLQDASAEASGADIHIKASMTKEQLEMIASMAKSAMGAFGGAHGGMGGDMGDQ
jgi:hypothetical protein